MNDRVPERLTVERLFGDPPVTALPPSRLRFSADGDRLAFLMPATDQRGRLDLWVADCRTGKTRCLLDARELARTSPSTADQERLERQRQFGSGITTFEWFPSGDALLVPMSGLALKVDLSGTYAELKLPRPGIGDLRLSPRGNYLTYVSANNLYAYDIARSREIEVTRDGGECVANGLAEFIAQEEMHRFEGYWWAPDESRLVFTRVDSSPIPVSHRLEVAQDEVLAIAQRYAFAGGPNAAVTLHEYRLESGESRELPIDLDAQDYLARVGFVGSRLTVQAQGRGQQWLEVRGENGNGHFEPWLTETSNTWINLHDNLQALGETGFLWTSERDGLARLFLGHAGDPASLHAVAPDDLHVTHVLAQDGASAYVQGWRTDPTERHLFSVDLPTREAKRRTVQPGWHDGVVHAGRKRYACVWSDNASPPELRLQDLASGLVTRLHGYPASHPARTLTTSTPVFGTLPAKDGQVLYWRVTPPRGVTPDTTAPHPVIVHVYGGPGAQRVCNAHLPSTLRLLSDAGFGVLELDNRGSANRGRVFEAPIHRHLGGVEVEDQVLGVSILERFAWADMSRVGIFGHSYGGFLTLMCLCKAPDVFRAGAAVAPVSDWRLYDTHYTERYLGNPATDPEPYARSSVVPHLAALQRPLLLVHGMADDNVLVTHSTKVMRELQRHGKTFELMLYPGSRHALQERDVSVHRFTQLLDFFGRTL